MYQVSLTSRNNTCLGRVVTRERAKLQLHNLQCGAHLRYSLHIIGYQPRSSRAGRNGVTGPKVPPRLDVWLATPWFKKQPMKKRPRRFHERQQSHRQLPVVNFVVNPVTTLTKPKIWIGPPVCFPPLPCHTGYAMFLPKPDRRHHAGRLERISGHVCSESTALFPSGPLPASKLAHGYRLNPHAHPQCFQ